MNNETQIVTKDHAQEQLKKHGVKFFRWTQLYFDKKSETYGNGTQSALKVYKCKNYNVAGAIASENLQKLKSIGLTFDEIEGRGAQFWLQVAAKKALEGSYEQVLDFMTRMGYMEKDSNVPSNQINQQFNFGDLATSFAQARKERGLDTHTTIPTADSGVRSITRNDNQHSTVATD